ncbi:MAG: ABC transporter substrate-binding protein [Candidatus Dormibacteraeota bacterium]|nr:ABC transporter substrate-binding protein [Candidatus Dormibacteraeota bacterium]MBV9525188.1 ABC transporter substrate-binding protein [Candidatus Dormibacteraeota bacterium]
MRTVRRRAPAFCAAAAALVASVACGANADTGSLPTAQLSPQLQKLVDGARAEGSLDLIFATAGTDDEIQPWTSGFNHYYGLNLRVTFTQNPVMPSVASTLIEELHAKRAANTDVYFGVAIFIAELENAGVLASGGLAGLPNVAGHSEDSDTTVALSTIPTGITYNADRVKGSAIPHTFKTLLSEAPSLHIASEPYAGTLAGLPRYWGADQTIAYTAALSKHLTGLFGCGEESRLVAGEFDIFAPDCGDNAARRLQAQGAPIGEVLPTDGSFITNTYLAIPATAPHPNAARLWVNYLLSRQAQDILWKSDFMDSSAISGSHIAPLIAQDERNGVVFHHSDMASVRLDAPFQAAQTCIQAILNNQVNDPSCDAYRSVIAGATG